MELIRVVTKFIVEVDDQLYLRKELKHAITWYYLNDGQTDLVYDIDKRDKLEERFTEYIQDNDGI